MNNKHLFKKEVQLALDWVAQVHNHLGWANKEESLTVLRIVLHRLRDHLSIVDATYLSAQLPVMIRGIYFEGWNPSEVPTKKQHADVFIASLQDTLERSLWRPFIISDVERIIKIIFQTLSTYIDPVAFDKIYFVLPFRVSQFMDHPL